jgi:NAD(P)-dependent dehydrogenase (short-subunit alcohol dehydrogenase family)
MINITTSRISHVYRGVMGSTIDKLTKDGYDLQFGVNLLGHFHFTTLLLPAILNTPEARIVNVTSKGHQLAPSGGFYWDRLKGPKTGTMIPIMGLVERYRFYGQSKLVSFLLDTLHSYLSYPFHCIPMVKSWPYYNSPIPHP